MTLNFGFRNGDYLYLPQCFSPITNYTPTNPLSLAGWYLQKDYGLGTLGVHEKLKRSSSCPPRPNSQ
jgi:hypothetical protein